MKLIFNELSLNPELVDIYSARDSIERFILTYNEAIKEKHGFEREITSSIDFNSLVVANDYPISKWRNDPEVDRDLIRRYIGICEKQNLEEIFDDEIEVSSRSGVVGKGLLCAYENTGVCISFTNDNYWKNFKIDCKMYSLVDDETSDICILNISEKSQLSEHNDELQKLRKIEIDLINTPEQLLDKLDSLFPSLVFNQVAIEQLRHTVEIRHVSTICNKLLELEKYFSSWIGGAFDESAFPTKSVSPQSMETLKRFRTQHTFEFDEKEIIVSYHMRYTGKIPGRIYFYPDTEIKKGLICSLTTKLPTVNEPKMRI